MDSSTSKAPLKIPFEGPPIVLHRPQIPQNTGNIARLCVGIRSPLIITGRAGFNFDAASVRRAGLDHWSDLTFYHFLRFKDFLKAFPKRRIVAVTKTGRESALTFEWQRGDIPVFGSETQGLSPTFLRYTQYSVYIPMSGPVRSLNLSNAVAVVAYAYVQRLYGSSAHHLETEYPRHAFTRRP